MLESVAGKGGVIHLDVDLEVLVKSVGAEETDNGLGVHIVLMLGRLHRLRLDEERAFETAGASIVTGSLEHLCEMVFLSLHLSVEKTHVALAASPEDVIRSSKLDSRINGVLDLHSSTGDNIEVRIGGGTVHIPSVTKHIGGSPKKLDVGTLHLLKSIVGDGLHAGFIFINSRSLVNKIHIVEAEVLDAQLVHDLEASVHLVLCPLDRIRSLVPLVVSGLATELVTARLTECVPPSHGEFEPILHLLSEDYSLRVIIMKRQRVLAFHTLERNLTDLREIFFCHNTIIINKLLLYQVLPSNSRKPPDRLPDPLVPPRPSAQG